MRTHWIIYDVNLYLYYISDKKWGGKFVHFLADTDYVDYIDI